MPSPPDQSAPVLEHVCDLKVKVATPEAVGTTRQGLRRIIPIIGGSVEGPRIVGRILGGGADWQMLRSDEVVDQDARYQMVTHDQVTIAIHNIGVRATRPDLVLRLAAGESVSPFDYYFRGTLRFEAPDDGCYGWLNSTIFVTSGAKLPDYVLIRVWQVM